MSVEFILRSYATPEEFRACVMVDIEGMNVLGDVVQT